MGQRRNQDRKSKIPEIKWKWKHNKTSETYKGVLRGKLAALSACIKTSERPQINDLKKKKTRTN